MRTSRGIAPPPAKQVVIVSSPQPQGTRSSWLLKALGIVGIAASIFILISLRRSDSRFNFGVDRQQPAPAEAAKETVDAKLDEPVNHQFSELPQAAATKTKQTPLSRPLPPPPPPPPPTVKAPLPAIKKSDAPIKAAAKPAPVVAVTSSNPLQLRAKQQPPPTEAVEVKESQPGLKAPLRNLRQQSSTLYATDVDYSGLYRADGEHESYAGAWLAPKRRILASWRNVNRTSNLEGTTMAISGYGRQQDPRITLMTRDFFDFQVLHLSVTTNFIDSVTRGGGDRAVSGKLFDRVMEQMTGTVKALVSDPVKSMEQHGDDRLKLRTIAIIPFTGFSASTDGNAFQSNIRKLYFRATFFSVYRYIRTIIVSVPSQNDFDVLSNMKLPIWKILNFKDRYDPKVNMEHPRSPVRLPKHTLLHVMQEMKRNPAYQRFEYAYYSEGDLVLHLRSEKQLLDALDASGGHFAASPHRLQSNPLPKIYTKEMQALWDKSAPHKFHKASLSDVQLVTEDGYLPKGSCCDNGRFDFRDCGNWWYYCPKWGLSNFTTWVRFGENGFTLPLGTEHRARCTFSADRKTCPMPQSCKNRVPSSANNVCGEYPNVERTYVHPR